MSYKYVIMAAGAGTRWNNYLGVPKHLLEINGETLLGRTTRLLKENGITDFIITCHDPRYAQYGMTTDQHHYDCEVDRFDEEITDGPVCYLYGDVYYTENAIEQIINTEPSDILFFGHTYEIFAVKVKDRELFFKHKNKIKQMYLSGEIGRCIGWEVYRSINNLPLAEHKLADRYVLIVDGTDDIDYPYEYEQFKTDIESKGC